MSMPTAAEMRRKRRMEHLMGMIIPLVAGRVLGGKDPQPPPLPRRLVTVVSGDVDVDAGCGAVWLVWRPWSSKAETYTARVEHHGGQFRYMGAGVGGGAVLDHDVAAGRPAAGPGAGSRQGDRGLEIPEHGRRRHPAAHRRCGA